LIVTDSCVQLAIAFLHSKCEQGTPRESRDAKEILTELGVPLFIPDVATRKRTKNLTLRFYDNQPIYLVSAVYLYEFVVRQYVSSNLTM
jgi:hypothetical protein